jgi:Pentapeptide repeats (9 copies)
MARRSPTAIAPHAPHLPDELEPTSVDAAAIESGEEWSRARGGSLWRARVDRARLTGLSWTEGLVRDAVFSDCRVDLSSFAATRLEQVVFERCLLMQTDFEEAQLRSVRFLDCDLSEADLSAARFDRCELRGCTIDGIRGAERLRGVAMPWEDILACAGTFAAAVGVTILADDR